MNTRRQANEMRSWPRKWYVLWTALLLSIAVMVPLFAAVAQPAEQKLVDAAKAEGASLTLYAVSDPVLLAPALARFKERYGIAVEHVRLTSAPLGQRFSAEAKSGANIADVFITTDGPFILSAEKSGWLAPIDQLPSLAAQPTMVVSPSVALIARLPFVLLFNTEQLAAADRPKVWADLAHDRYRGKLLLSDPRTSFSAMAFYQMLRENAGDDFVKKLQVQATFTKSAIAGAQQVAAGSVMAMIPGVFTVVGPLREKGAPIDQIILEPTVSADNYMAVAKAAPHPNGAKLLANFLTGEEGLALYNKGGYSPIPVTGSLPLPKLVSFSDEKIKAAEPEILALLGLD
jgi:iron(III) transport system substrate-binding protein